VKTQLQEIIIITIIIIIIIKANTLALFSQNEMQNSTHTYHESAEMYTLLFK